VAWVGRRPARPAKEVETGGGKGVEEPIEFLCQVCCTRFWPEGQLKAPNGCWEHFKPVVKTIVFSRSGLEG
jgi:hypothetical protein